MRVVYKQGIFYFPEDDQKMATLPDREIWAGTSVGKVELSKAEDYTYFDGNRLFFAAKVGNIDGLVEAELFHPSKQSIIRHLKSSVTAELSECKGPIGEIYSYIKEYYAKNKPYRGHTPFVSWKRRAPRDRQCMLLDGFSAYWWPTSSNLLSVLADVPLADFLEVAGMYKDAAECAEEGVRKVLKLFELAQHVRTETCKIDFNGEEREIKTSYILGNSLEDALNRCLQINKDEDFDEFLNAWLSHKASKG